jgi:sugar lactone lactonase YvrE
MTFAKADTLKLPTESAELGEGPHYERETNTAFWCDIVGKRLLEYRFADGTARVHDLPKMASLVARIDDARQLLVMEDGFYVREKADGTLSLLAPLEADNPSTRSNDGRVHPSGRLWIGTMGRNAEHEAGAIYCFDGRKLKKLFSRITIPNSICFTADGRTGYFADSAVNTVWRVALDPATGLPASAPEVALTENDLPLGGVFDGSVMDLDGVLWNAAYGGGSVSGFAPDGSLARTFEIPAAQTTCPCFIGPALDRLLVTSAFQGYSPSARQADPGAGFTFVIDGGFRGQADAAFRLVAEEV